MRGLFSEVELDAICLISIGGHWLKTTLCGWRLEFPFEQLPCFRSSPNSPPSMVFGLFKVLLPHFNTIIWFPLMENGK
ncbi:hypothetical protein V6N11_026491 [Hibiscus sabdariffa]|uniref:Uncharacterized protein n=1 Tax=Hibiscus sabdariffa TaxID=183260 RepID=A0ABR2SVW1_9ROSI